MLFIKAKKRRVDSEFTKESFGLVEQSVNATIEDGLGAAYRSNLGYDGCTRYRARACWCLN